MAARLSRCSLGKDGVLIPLDGLQRQDLQLIRKSCMDQLAHNAIALAAVFRF
jgi:hypothetical protein